MRNPHARCRQQCVEPEVEEHSATVGTGDGCSPDIPVSEGRIESGHLRLEGGNIGRPERGTVKGREIHGLRQILASVADEALWRPGHQAESPSTRKTKR